MIRQATQTTRPLAVSTPLGPDKLLLQRFEGTEAVSRLFRFQLDMLSTDLAIRPRALLGRNITFVVRCRDSRPRYFNGYVSRLEAGAVTASGKYRKYRAQVVPWLWFLARTTDCRIFQDKSVPAILRQIFQDLGFSNFNMSGLQGHYPPRGYCVQYRETDLNFVCRLMEEEGIYYYFAHRNGKHVLVLGDSVAGYRWCRQRELRFEATRSSSPDEDRITAWEHRYEFRSGKVAHTDYNFETPSKTLMAVETGKVSLPNNAGFELYDYPGDFARRGDGRRLARVRIEEEELPYDTVVGESTCPLLSAGRMFTYRDYQIAAESGQTRLITSIQHAAIEPNAFETLGESDRLGLDEPLYRNQFACIPDSVCFRPSRVTPKAVVQGAQTAVVVGPQGEEIYPDEYGRVKVQFHWDREGKRDENSSCWLRVSQKHAGQGWGDIDLPRIGEEVIVDFLEGDPDRPIITGRVYNGAKRTPFALPGSMTRSGGKSNTHKGSGYNEMTMDDTAGQEQVRVNAQYNMDTVIGNNETLQVGVDRATDIGNNDTLTIGVDGSLKVGNDCQVTVGNNATYVVGNNVVFTAGVAITLQCGASTIHMNQAGVITISGSFVTSAARANHAIVAPITQIVGSNLLLQAGLVTLDLGAVTHVKGGETTVAGANVSISGAGETLLMGLPLMLGEVGAPLEGLPEAPGAGGSSAETETGRGGSGGGEAGGASAGTTVEEQPPPESDPAPAEESEVPQDAPQQSDPSEETAPPEPDPAPEAEDDTTAGVKASGSIGKKGPEAGVSTYAEKEVLKKEADLGIVTASRERKVGVEMGTGTEGGKVKVSVEEKVGLTNPLGDELYCKGGGNVDTQGKGGVGVECGIKGALNKDEKIGVSIGRDTNPKIVSVETKTDDKGTTAIKACLNVRIGSLCVSHETKNAPENGEPPAR